MKKTNIPYRTTIPRAVAHKRSLQDGGVTMISNKELYDKIELEIVGYDEHRWQVRYPNVTDECFWIPKEEGMR